MPKGQLISKEIPEQTVQDVTNQTSQIIDEVKPYEVNLSPDEMSNFPTVSNERLGFVVKGVEYVGTDPEYMPGKVDLDEFNRDNELFVRAREMFLPVAQLHRMLLNLMRLAGSDVYVTLLRYYRSIREEAAMGDARAMIIYEDLKGYFSQINTTSGENNAGQQNSNGNNTAI